MLTLSLAANLESIDSITSVAEDVREIEQLDKVLTDSREQVDDILANSQANQKIGEFNETQEDVLSDDFFANMSKEEVEEFFKAVEAEVNQELLAFKQKEATEDSYEAMAAKTLLTEKGSGDCVQTNQELSTIETPKEMSVKEMEEYLKSIEAEREELEREVLGKEELEREDPERKELEKEEMETKSSD